MQQVQSWQQIRNPSHFHLNSHRFVNTPESKRVGNWERELELFQLEAIFSQLYKFVLFTNFPSLEVVGKSCIFSMRTNSLLQ